MLKKLEYRQVLALLLFFVLASPIALADVWEGPPGDPPLNNRSRPLDISADSQTKSGALIIQGGLTVGSANQLQVDNLGVFTTKLEVNANDVAGAVYGHGANHGVVGLTTAVNTYAAIYGQAANGGWAGYFSGPFGVLGNSSFMGNVGINTAAPNYKLDVQGGQINASGGLCINGDCKLAWDEVGGGGSFWEEGGVPADHIFANNIMGPSEFKINNAAYGGIWINNNNLVLENNSAIFQEYAGQSSPVLIDDMLMVGRRWSDPDCGHYCDEGVDLLDNENLIFGRVRQVTSGNNDPTQNLLRLQRGDGSESFIDKFKIDLYGNAYSAGGLYTSGGSNIDQVNDYADLGIYTEKDAKNQGADTYASVDDYAVLLQSRLASNDQEIGIGFIARQDQLDDLYIPGAAISYRKDVQGDGRGSLLFRTRGDATDNLVRMFVGSDIGGNPDNTKIGIGTDAPNKLLHLYQTSGANAEIDLQSVAGAGEHWAIYNDRTTEELRVWKNGANNLLALTENGLLKVNGNIETYNISLDSFRLNDVTHGSLPGDLWLGLSDGFLKSCNSSGYCLTHSDEGVGVNEMAVFNGKLWLGFSDGRLKSCDAIGDCDDHGDKGNAITALKVFANKLWMGQSNGDLSSCDDSALCSATQDRGSSIDAFEVFSGKLWLGESDHLESCDAGGNCADHGDKGNSITSLKVFSDKLWVGQSNGDLSSCDSLANCASSGDKGDAINAMDVFAGKLWLASSDDHLDSCDSSGACADHGDKGSDLMDLEPFNSELWVVDNNGVLYSCNSSGSCISHGDKGNAGNALANYNLTSLIYLSGDDTIAIQQCGGYLETMCSGGYEGGGGGGQAPPWQTLNCAWHYANGYVTLNRYTCNDNDNNWIYHQGPPANNVDPQTGLPYADGQYCNIQCPSGTTMVTGGGCNAYWNGVATQSRNNSFWSDDGQNMGWECLAMPGSIQAVWVTCYGPDFSGAGGYQCPP